MANVISCRAGKAATLNPRLEAIANVRFAFNDVVRYGVITAETAASIRNARQTSSVVFSPKIIASLDRASHIASRLQGESSIDQLLDQHEKDRLSNELDDILRLMIAETQLNR